MEAKERVTSLEAILNDAVNALFCRACASTVRDPQGRLGWLGAYLKGEQPELGELLASAAERSLAVPGLEAALSVACTEVLRESIDDATIPLAWRVGQRLQHATIAPNEPAAPSLPEFEESTPI